jgi:hypothetical protein
MPAGKRRAGAAAAAQPSGQWRKTSGMSSFFATDEPSAGRIAML